MSENTWLNVDDLAKKLGTEVAQAIHDSYSGDYMRTRGERLAGQREPGEKYSDTGRTQEQQLAAKSATAMGQVKNAVYYMEQIESELAKYGARLERSVSTTTTGLIRDTYKIINAQKQVLHQFDVPVDRGGRIYYDSLERANLYYPTADKEGHLHMESAIEVGLARALRQLTASGNTKILKSGFSSGASQEQQSAAARRLKWVFDRQIRSAVNPSAAISQYNPDRGNELRRALGLTGSERRANVVESTAYLEHMFDTILSSVTGGGSFADQDKKRTQYLQKIDKMSLLVRSVGFERGMHEILGNSYYSDIVNSKIFVPVMTAIGEFAAIGSSMGEVSDANGLKLTYMQGLDRAFNFLLPPSSRKGYQTELGVRDFKNMNQRFSHTKGARFVTQGELKSGAKLDSKAYDTIRMLPISQSQLVRAVKAYKTAYSASHGGDDKALRALDLLSVGNDALVLNRAAAEERFGLESVSKTISSAMIQQEYDKLVRGSKNGRGTKTLAKQAVRAALRAVHGGSYDESRDFLAFGEKRAAEPNEELNEFLQQYWDRTTRKFDLEKMGSTVSFGIRKDAKVSDPLKMAKWFGEGTEIRATAQYVDDALWGGLLEHVASVLAADSNGAFSKEDYARMLSGTAGLIDAKQYSRKNIITQASGLFNDFVGTLLNKGETPKAIADKVKTVLSKRTINGQKLGAVKVRSQNGQTEMSLEQVFESVFNPNENGEYVQSTDKDALSLFTQYSDIFVQALSEAVHGEDNRLLGFSGQNGPASYKSLFEQISSGKSPALRMRYNNPFAVSLLRMGGHYGDAGSKSGYPVAYGYRELDSINSQIGFAKSLGRDVSALSSYYGSLGAHGQIPKTLYDNLVDYQRDAIKHTWNFNAGHAMDSEHGIILDINNLAKGRELIDLEDIRDTKEFGDTGLFFADDLEQKTLIGAIQKAQREKWDTLSKETKNLFLKKAGGADAVAEEMALLRAANSSLTEEDARRQAEINVGASFIPYAISYTKNGKQQLFSRGEGVSPAAHLFGPRLGLGGRISPFGDKRVVEIGPNATGLERFLRDLYDYSSGAIEYESTDAAARKFGESFYRLQESEWDALTKHRGAIFDKAHKVDVPHSFMPQNFSTNSVKDVVGELGESVASYMSNAIVVSEDDLRAMLQPTKEEADAFKSAGKSWSDWLKERYIDMLGTGGEKTVSKLVEQTQKALRSKSKWAKMTDEALAGSAEWAGALEGATRQALEDAIVSGATLGGKNFQSRGLLGLLNRYPSITGRNDVRASKLYVNPEWKGQRGVIGGDATLMEGLNADFDGDHLVFSLMGSDGRRQKFDIDLTPSQILSQGRELLEVQEQESAVWRFLDQMLGGGSSATQPGLKEGATDTDIEQENRNIYYTKSGKSFVGAFSNLRQAFSNALSREVNTENPNYKERIAVEALLNMMAIPEQKVISMKKGKAGSGTGFSTSLDDMYSRFKDASFYEDDSKFGMLLEDIATLSETKERQPGAFGIFDATDMAQKRLAYPLISAIMMMAQSVGNDEAKENKLQQALNDLFGENTVTVDKLAAAKFSRSRKGDEGSELRLEGTGLDEIFRAMQFDRDFYKRVRGTLDEHIQRNADTFKIGGVRISRLGDIIRKRYSILPGLSNPIFNDQNGQQWMRPNDTGVQFTSEQLETLKENGFTVNADKNAILWDEAAQEKFAQQLAAQEVAQSAEAARRAIGERYFDAEAQTKLLHDKTYSDFSMSATGLSKILFPYTPKGGVQYDYEKFLENLGDADPYSRATAEDLENMYGQFASREGGTLVHTIAQRYLEAAKAGRITIGGDLAKTVGLTDLPDQNYRGPLEDAISEYEIKARKLGRPVVPVNSLIARGKESAAAFVGALGDNGQLGPIEVALLSFLGDKDSPIYSRLDMTGSRVVNRRNTISKGELQGLAMLAGVDKDKIPALNKEGLLEALNTFATSDKFSALTKESQELISSAIDSESSVSEFLIGDTKTSASGHLTNANIIQAWVEMMGAKAFLGNLINSDIAKQFFAGTKSAEDVAQALLGSDENWVKSLLSANKETGKGSVKVRNLLVQGLQSLSSEESRKRGGYVRSVFTVGSPNKDQEGTRTFTLALPSYADSDLAASIMAKAARTRGLSEEEFDTELSDAEKAYLELQKQNAEPTRVFSGLRENPRVKNVSDLLSQVAKKSDERAKLVAKLLDARAKGDEELANTLQNELDELDNEKGQIDTLEGELAVLRTRQAELRSKNAKLGKKSKKKESINRELRDVEDLIRTKDNDLRALKAGSREEIQDKLLSELSVIYKSGEGAEDLNNYLTEHGYASLVGMATDETKLGDVARLMVSAAAQDPYTTGKMGERGVKEWESLVARRDELVAQLRERQRALTELDTGDEATRTSLESDIATLRKNIEYYNTSIGQTEEGLRWIKFENGQRVLGADGEWDTEESAFLSNARLRYTSRLGKRSIQEYASLLAEQGGLSAERDRITSALESASAAEIPGDVQVRLRKRLGQIDQQLTSFVEKRLSEIEATFAAEGKNADPYVSKKLKEMRTEFERMAPFDQKIGAVRGEISDYQQLYSAFAQIGKLGAARGKLAEDRARFAPGSTHARLLEFEDYSLQQQEMLAKATLGKLKETYRDRPDLVERAQAHAALSQREEDDRRADSKKVRGVADVVEGSLGSMLKSMFSGYGLIRALNRVIQSVQKVTAEAKELDKALTNLRIVTGDTKTETRNLLTDYSKLAQSLGSTTKEVANSAVGWLRQGYSLAESMDLVKSSMYLSTLGMMDSATATKSLTIRLAA